MSKHHDIRTRVLVLGGTTEARQFVQQLRNDQRYDMTLSLAGRTAQPDLLQGLPVRIGGFGGTEGLVKFLIAERIGFVLDATHPFAAQISAHAVSACALADVALLALERPAWIEKPGDRWRAFDSVKAAVAALPQQPVHVFSGLGRLSLDELQAAPQHHYVIRIIDPLRSTLVVPNTAFVYGRGPFKTGDDIALFRAHGIQVILSKNSGGDAAYSKIAAARELGLPVHMINRPYIPKRKTVATLADALAAVAAHHDRSTDRGV